MDVSVTHSGIVQHMSQATASYTVKIIVQHVPIYKPKKWYVRMGPAFGVIRRDFGVVNTKIRANIHELPL